MELLPRSQKLILEQLLENRDGLSLQQLADKLQLSKTGVKEHILKMEQLGLVGYRDEVLGVGRPRRFYLLLESGLDLFPKQYSWLSNIILSHLGEEIGPGGISKLMRSIAVKVGSETRNKMAHEIPSNKLMQELSKIMNEMGYRSVVKQSDFRKGGVLEASHCVYHNVAQKHPELCQFDIQFLQTVSGKQVTLEECIARGGKVCRFCLKDTSRGAK